MGENLITVHATLNPASVDFSDRGRYMEDTKTHTKYPLDDDEVAKRIGIPVQEAVFCLPLGSRIIRQDELHGTLRAEIPHETAEAYARELMERISLNRRKMWTATVGDGRSVRSPETLLEAVA